MNRLVCTGLAFAGFAAGALTLGAASRPALAKATDLAAVLEKSSCQTQVADLLAQWGTSSEWKRQVDPGVNVRAYRAHGAELGTVLELHVFQDGNVEAFRVTPHTSVQAMWKKPDCVAVLNVTRKDDGGEQASAAKPAKSAPSFTDEDLQKVIGEHKAGVIYAWSPHMILSEKSFANLKKAAAKHHLPVIVVLDPQADQAFAEKEARKTGFGKGALRRIASVELLSRNINIHYPDIVVFQDGRISERIMPGFKEVKQYEEFIELELKRVKQGE